MSIVDAIRERQCPPRFGGWPRGWRQRTDKSAPVVFDAGDVDYISSEIASADCPEAVEVMLTDAAVAELEADAAEAIDQAHAEAAYLRDYARMVRLACRVSEWNKYAERVSTPRPAGHLPERIDAADIKARIDLPSYIDKHVHLVKAGHDRFVGVCPFHGDKSPSMSVWADGHWKCFGCGVGGDVFEFVKLWHKCDFREALTILGGT